jgi:hypothetical protein
MATRLFTVDLDLGLNKAKRFIFEDYNTTPSTGANAGRVIYWTAADSSANHLKVYNGSAWKTIAYTDDVPDISISLDAPDVFSVTGSPANASGTLTFDWVDVEPNTVLAGYTSGSVSGTPSFRSLVDADIPVEIARVDDVNTSLEDYILTSTKGEPLGVAELNASGVVPAEQLDLSDYVTLNGQETLTYKTFNDRLYFTDPQAVGAGSIEFSPNQEFNVIANAGNIVISALEGGEYLGSATSANQIATVGDIDAISTTISGTTYEIEVTTTGTNDYIIGLPDEVEIAASLKLGGASKGKLYLYDNSANEVGQVGASTGQLDVLSTSYPIVLNANTNGEYLGSATTANQIATIGDITNAAITVSNVDGNLDISTSGTAVTIDLADNITISNSITFDGVWLSLTANTTGGVSIFDENVPSINIGGTGSTVTIGDDLVVNGDLTVNGSTTTLNTETLVVEDNIVVLNSSVTGTPTANAGIEVERGTSTNASVLWDETAEVWKVGLTGSEIAVARKYVTTTTGTTHTVTHNLGTSDVTVNCWVSGEQIEANVVVTDANTVTVTTNSSLTVKTVVVG